MNKIKLAIFRGLLAVVVLAGALSSVFMAYAIPTVTASAASVITATTATLNGEITANEDSTIDTAQIVPNEAGPTTFDVSADPTAVILNSSIIKVGTDAEVMIVTASNAGNAAISGGDELDGGTGFNAGNTILTKDSPINNTGVITVFNVNTSADLTGFVAAIFYLVSGDTYRCRSSQLIGNVSAGVQSFPVSLTCNAGDFVGAYCATGNGIYRHTVGGDGSIRAILGTNKTNPGDQFLADYSQEGQGWAISVSTPASSPSLTVTRAQNSTAAAEHANGENVYLLCDIRGFVYDTATHADPGNVAPAASAYASNWTEAGSFGAATFSGSITGLTPGTTYYFRSVGHNSAGYAYSAQDSFTSSPEDAGKILLRGALRLLTAGVIVVGVVLKSGNKGTGLMIVSVLGIISFAVVDALIALI